MTRKLMVFLAALTLSFAAVVATDSRASASPAPPPGVKADAWQYISDSVGLAIHFETNRKGERELVGTLMIRERSRWAPVRLAADSIGMVPAR